MILSTLMRNTTSMQESMEEALRYKSHMINIQHLIFNGFKKVFGIKGEKPTAVMIQNKFVTDDASLLLETIKGYGADLLNNNLSIAGSKSNSSKRYNLEIDREIIGDFTLLELEALHQLLSNETIQYYYESLPTRSADIVWRQMDHNKHLFTSGPQPLICDHCHFQHDNNATLTFDLSQTARLSSIYHESDFTLLEYEQLSSALSLRHKKSILDRLSTLKNAVAELLDEARAIPIETAGNIGQKIFNYIHTGNGQGEEFIPY